LQGIVEADETYIGGKPRKKNKQNDNDPKNPRGRGTKKIPVIGIVERGGRVVAQSAKKLSAKYITHFIEKYLDTTDSILITDEYKGYNKISKKLKHFVIKHSEQFVKGDIHTNEGFWSLLKRAYVGSHHHYNEKYLPLYVAETTFKYNRRTFEPQENFEGSIGLMLAL